MLSIFVIVAFVPAVAFPVDIAVKHDDEMDY